MNYQSIRWDITNKCNLQCLHCYNEGHSTQKEINLKQVITIIDKVNKISGGHLKEISFAGKEPTLRPDFLDMAQYCYENKISYSVSTNGTVWKEDNFSHLLRLSPATLLFSIDGLKENHETVRGKSTYDVVLNNIFHSQDYIKSNALSTTIGISFTINKLNRKDLIPIVRMMKNIGIDHFRINPISLFGSAAGNQAALSLSPEEEHETFRDLAQELATQRISGESFLIGAYPAETRLLNFQYGLNFPVVVGGCSAQTTLYIDPYGQALPCFVLESAARENPQLLKYVNKWDILHEPFTEIAENKFRPFIDWATRTCGGIKEDRCRGCSDENSCRICPLLQNTFSLNRCYRSQKEMKEHINKISLTAQTKIVIEANSSISYDSEQELMAVLYKNSLYQNAKNFRLSSDIFKAISLLTQGPLPLENIYNNFFKDAPHLDCLESREQINSLIKYFIRENVINIRS